MQNKNKIRTGGKCTHEMNDVTTTSDKTNTRKKKNAPAAHDHCGPLLHHLVQQVALHHVGFTQHLHGVQLLGVFDPGQIDAREGSLAQLAQHLEVLDAD